MLGIISSSKFLVRPSIITTIQNGTRSFTTLKKELPTVYEPLPKKRTGESVLAYLYQKMLNKYDPSGRRRILSKTLRAGDVIRVTYLDRTDVVGRIIAIKRGDNNVGSNILIRNKLNKVGVELRIPLYSPKLRNIEVIQKPEVRLARNKQYYIRNTRLDVQDVESSMKRKEAKKIKETERKDEKKKLRDQKAAKLAKTAAKREAKNAEHTSNSHVVEELSKKTEST
ncbi:putative ribosomal protein, mitochondrial precursor, large subunit [Scheffersomyces amazonensis]|uniref:putative ribosomal protein, mitochondrial precursor, large subunit n=1 Tax=Scheffersomyces amazonensis TaxID=1078765 RepID=UPI00315DF835